MNIVVLMKQVPDTAAQVKANADGTDIDRDGLEYVISPYDEYAIEEALKIKGERDGTVTLVCAGPERTQKSIRQGLAMGADEAVHIDDPAVESADAVGLARALAKACESLEAGLVLCGREGVDKGQGTVGAAVAEFLGWPQASDVTELELGDGNATAKVERAGGGHARIEVSLPAVLTAQKGLNEPRYASLKGIMQAKRKPIHKKTLADLGLDADAVAPKVTLKKLAPPPVREKTLRKFEGDGAAAQAQACVDALVNELKIV